MPEMVTLTRELIEAGCHGTGGYNKRQLQILGIRWPPKKGWKEWLVRERKQITAEQLAEFVRLRGRSKAVVEAEQNAAELDRQYAPPSWF